MSGTRDIFQNFDKEMFDGLVENTNVPLYRWSEDSIMRTISLLQNELNERNNKFQEDMEKSKKIPRSETEMNINKLAKDILIEKLEEFDKNYPNTLQPEWFDWLDILPEGHKKHGETWLNGYGNNTMDKDSQVASLSRHIGKGFYGLPLDKDSGKLHLYHAICRLQFAVTLYKRNIIHEKDVCFECTIEENK